MNPVLAGALTRGLFEAVYYRRALAAPELVHRLAFSWPR